MILRHINAHASELLNKLVIVVSSSSMLYLILCHPHWTILWT